MNNTIIERGTDIQNNPLMPRANNVPLENRGRFWQGNMSEKFTIKESTENNGRFDVVLDEPFQDIRVNTTLQDNKMHGITTFTSEEGIDLGFLTFVEGIATGPCILNDESGKLYFKGRMKEGYRHGRGTEYDESGNVTFDGFYDKGTKLENIVPLEEVNGYWKEYNAEHKLVSISRRDDFGRKEGICYFYDAKGEIRRISEWKEGKEISLFGSCEIYDEPRKVWYKGHFENGYRNWKGVEYDESGNVTFDGFYSKGKRLSNIVKLEEVSGYWKEYNAEHKLVSISKRDDFGQKEGICYFYDDDEQIERISEWKEGKVISTSGYCNIYDEPRKVWYKGHFANGYRQGRGTEYDESGNVTFDGFYDRQFRIENIVPLEEVSGYWKEYNAEHKLVSISQRDDFGRKEGICYFYDGEEKIDRISEWKEDIEISTSGYCEIYDEPRKVWYKGYFANGKQVYYTPAKEKKGYWEEYNEDNKLVCICSKDKEGKYDGICYLYSNEKLNRISYWEHGREVRVIKQFNGLTMTEFDDEGQKCYEGGYNELVRWVYLRHGIGEEYDLDGITLLFKGNYHNGRRHGKGTSYKNNEVNKKTTWLTGYSKQGLLLTFLAIVIVLILLFVVDVILGLVVTAIVDLLIIIRWSCPKLLGSKICNKTDLQLMADYVKTKSSKNTETEKGKEKEKKEPSSCFYNNIYLSITVILSLIIICVLIGAHFYYSLVNPYVSVFQGSYKVGANKLNKVSGFKVSNRALLKSIEIGAGCFEVASVFQIKGLSSLNSVKIGSNSFTGQRNNFGNDGSKSFHVLNCKNLQSIEIGEYSFSDFGGEFEIKNLPSLKSLEIGVMNKSSYNFYSVKSFLIEGMKSYSVVDN